MNFMNHETQLDLRLAGSKEFGLLLKLILYTSFEVITGFLCPFNRRIRFKTQFHAIVSLVEKTFQTANKQGRAERKLLHVKMSSGATYAERRTPYAVRRGRAEKRVRMLRDLRKRTWAQARANSKPKEFPGQQHAWIKMQKIRPVLKR